LNEDRSTRYHRLKRRLGILSVGWSVLLMTLLLATGASAALRDLTDGLAGTATAPATAPFSTLLYCLFLVLLHQTGSLPLGFYAGFLVERRYGLSGQTLASWVADQIKALIVSVLLGGIAVTVVYFFIRRSPEDWWLPTGLVFAMLIVGLANLGPVLLMPLFFRITPLKRDSLEARLLRLAERAGARVLGAFEWGLSDKTRKANAALAGLGRTRRILVSDTMLAEYSDDEIEVVLAHELAHHVHGDIWRGLLFESALMLAGAFVAARALSAADGLFGLRSTADVAGLPLLVLATGAVSLALAPLAHALSRRYERRADRFALELTKNPAAFTSAMKRLSAQNLAEEDPSRLVQILFYSHPPIRERIAAAQAFDART
jgi:STE24 endopeptidase